MEPTIKTAYWRHGRGFQPPPSPTATSRNPRATSSSSVCSFCFVFLVSVISLLSWKINTSHFFEVGGGGEYDLFSILIDTIRYVLLTISLEKKYIRVGGRASARQKKKKKKEVQVAGLVRWRKKKPRLNEAGRKGDGVFLPQEIERVDGSFFLVYHTRSTSGSRNWADRLQLFPFHNKIDFSFTYSRPTPSSHGPTYPLVSFRSRARKRWKNASQNDTEQRIKTLNTLHIWYVFGITGIACIFMYWPWFSWEHAHFRHHSQI